MIIRGGGATGADGLVGADACICVTLSRTGVVGGSTVAALPAGAAGATGRGGIAITGTGGAAAVVVVEPAAGVLAAGGGTGVFGGMTTTDGGRYVAATDAGVTIRGAGGVVVAGAGASTTGFGGTAFGAVTTGAAGVSAFASTVGAGAGAFTTGRAGGCSTTAFCCVIARSTSPGREICERSILVLKSSSPKLGREEVRALGAASERPRRCFRTKSAS
jgi:hypothetical protein